MKYLKNKIEYTIGTLAKAKGRLMPKAIQNSNLVTNFENKTVMI